MKFKIAAFLAALCARVNRVLGYVEDKSYVLTCGAQHTAYQVGVAEINADLNRKSQAVTAARRRLEEANREATAAVKGLNDNIEGVRAKVFG